MRKTKQLKGFVMILSAAALWGLSSTVAQPLLQGGMDTELLVTMRMIFSGILLLLFGLIKKDESIWKIWRERKARVPLIIFGLLGILGSQYTFFYAIKEGNAATAALLQYLGPAFILVYVAYRNRKMPTLKEFIALFLALFGTFLLVTGGSLQSLHVPISAVIWGLSSAVSLAIYTLQPVRLLEKWDSIVVVGWGMLIGGATLSILNPPIHNGIDLSSSTIISLLFIILLGTLVPYYLFIDSLRFIKPSDASIISTAEPLAAVIASIVWLKVPFGLGESIGGLAILLAVLTLALKSNKVKISVQSELNST